jgi:hypothetical protein
MWMGESGLDPSIHHRLRLDGPRMVGGRGMTRQERDHEVKLEIYDADGLYEHCASEGVCCELPLEWRAKLCPDCRSHEWVKQ